MNKELKIERIMTKEQKIESMIDSHMKLFNFSQTEAIDFWLDCLEEVKDIGSAKVKADTKYVIKYMKSLKE